MDELKKAAFNAIYKDGCDNCGDWIDTLVNCYSEEVVDTLGNNPNEVYAELEDIWETMDYEDPRTGSKTRGLHLYCYRQAKERKSG